MLTTAATSLIVAACMVIGLGSVVLLVWGLSALAHLLERVTR